MSRNVAAITPAMQCIFIDGPIASGKLTVANALHARSGLPVFHNHLAVDAALALFDFGSPSFVRLRESIWLSAFREAANAGRSFIFTFTPEASVPSSFIDEARGVIESAGGAVVYVRLICREAVIEARIGNESRGAFGKLKSLDEYRRLRDLGAFSLAPLPEPHMNIDTETILPEEAARQISEILSLPSGGIWP